MAAKKRLAMASVALGIGEWNTVYRRFSDWARKGIWYKMLHYFSEDADMEYMMIDSTILRAHACAAGAKKRGLDD